ncbi:MAG: hypothetical protein ACLFU4_03665 [Opitutales bacterium]
MLHFFFRWRYERRSRAHAYKLPPAHSRKGSAQANLGDFMSRQSAYGRSFKQHGRLRRSKWLRLAALLIGTALLLWIVYESVIALAAMSR